MKSIIGTIIMFIAVYVIVTSNILSFFAQDSFTIFAISAVVIMLIVAIIVLGLPGKKRGGYHEEKDKHLD